MVGGGCWMRGVGIVGGMAKRENDRKIGFLVCFEQ